MMLAEKKKIMKNCLKLFSILTELTDFKIEQYKWFDIIKNNNLYNITKLIQNLDMIPLYFIHNCAIVYHPEKNSESSANDMAIYMNFIQKLGILCNYNDLYPDYNYNKKNFEFFFMGTRVGGGSQSIKIIIFPIKNNIIFINYFIFIFFC